MESATGFVLPLAVSAHPFYPTSVRASQAQSLQRKTVSQLIKEFPMAICTDCQLKALTDDAESAHRNIYPNRSDPSAS